MQSSVTNPLLAEHIRWNDAGLIPAIAQDAASGRVLMLAWMNADALAQTLATGEAVYWSRSRAKLWHKGENSGHTQKVRDIQLDCDGDTLLLKVEQVGGIACHTGHQSCFFRSIRDGELTEIEPVLKSPGEIYSHD